MGGHEAGEIASEITVNTPDEDSIMIAAWPKETEDFAYAEDEQPLR